MIDHDTPQPDARRRMRSTRRAAFGAMLAIGTTLDRLRRRRHRARRPVRPALTPPRSADADRARAPLPLSTLAVTRRVPVPTPTTITTHRKAPPCSTPSIPNSNWPRSASGTPACAATPSTPAHFEAQPGPTSVPLARVDNADSDLARCDRPGTLRDPDRCRVTLDAMGYRADMSEQTRPQPRHGAGPSHRIGVPRRGPLGRPRRQERRRRRRRRRDATLPLDRARWTASSSSAKARRTKRRCSTTASRSATAAHPRSTSPSTRSTAPRSRLRARPTRWR